MPYICTRDNVYLGEHSCRRYHYGDMTMVRDCCIADARKYKALALRNAITTSHTAYRLFAAAYGSLTDAEQWQVGDIMQVWDHGPTGFIERPMQAELPI